MQKIGLTGSIAVGKSFVCDVFRELGCHVLDADKTAREVVAPGTAGIKQIEREFGSGVLLPDGGLDRKAMAEIVFADEQKRLLLNSIIHPLVIKSQNNWIAEQERADPDGIAIIDAALMIESGGYIRFEKLIVVWCDPAVQLKRLMSRDDVTETDARKRIDAQMPQEEKKRYADLLIDTSGSFEEVQQQVRRVFAQITIEK